jgi:hypothetical protein
MWFAFLVVLCIPSLTWASTLTIDNPADGAIVTGADAILGWDCDASTSLLQVQFDAGPLFRMPGRGTRGDTVGMCGDDDNGFAFGWNWALLTAGSHAIKFYKDGVLCNTRTVTVVNLGDEFLSGATGICTLEGFPNANAAVEIEWIEARQNFSIVGVDQGEPIDPDDPICTIQVGTFNQNGQSANFIIGNPCAGDRLNIAVEALGAQPFVACITDLTILQGENQFTDTQLDWTNSMGMQVCDPITQNEAIETSLVPGPSAIGLDFTQPFSVLYKGVLIADFM